MKINSLIKLIGSIFIIVLLALVAVNCSNKSNNKVITTNNYDIGYYTDTIDNIVIVSVVVNNSCSVSVSSIKLKEL